MTHLIVLNIGKRQMQAVSLDGTDVRTLVDGLDEVPDGVVVDQQRGHIYWTNMGRADTGSRFSEWYDRNGSIERVDLDGGNRTTIVDRGAFTTGKQLTADFDDGRLYWCDREGMQVLTCDLDGGDLRPIVTVATGPDAARDARNHCVGIAIDPARGHLYWSQKGPPKGGQGQVLRAPLPSAGRTAPVAADDIEVLWDGLPEPIDLELSGATLWWTDRGDDAAGGNTLNRAAVHPDVGAPEVVATAFDETIGLTMTSPSAVFVSDLGGTIRHVDLENGTDRPVVHLGPGLTGLSHAEL